MTPLIWVENNVNDFSEKKPVNETYNYSYVGRNRRIIRHTLSKSPHSIIG